MRTGCYAGASEGPAVCRPLRGQGCMCTPLVNGGGGTVQFGQILILGQTDYPFAVDGTSKAGQTPSPAKS